MTSRERVKRFLAGEAVDRIPNGLGGCETAGLHNIAYHRLKKVLGVDDGANRICTFMNNAIFEPAVLEAMEGDIILLGSGMCPSRFWGPAADREWKAQRLWDVDLQVANAWDFREENGSWWWGNRVCPPGALYFDSPAGQQVGIDRAGRQLLQTPDRGLWRGRSPFCMKGQMWSNGRHSQKFVPDEGWPGCR